MREALLYERLDGAVVCRLCPHNCRIGDGQRGLCGVRENRGGTLYSLVYGRPCATNVDPIEKKPLYHFLPGTSAYSIATVGCNLRCMHCQNSDISQMPRGGGEIIGRQLSPEEAVSEAAKRGCSSISYTYTEPTIFMEYALDISKIAIEQGIRNAFVSNGYMSCEAVEAVAAHIQADNVDLKSFSDKFYREICGASLEPVLDTMKALVKEGVWLEVTTLIIPGHNDSSEELKQIASFICSELGDHVPWHVSRFHPDYNMRDRSSTDMKKIDKACEIGREAGLKYVYGGNVPHREYENTYCPGCGELLIERYGYNITMDLLREGRCAKCGQTIEGVWM